MKVQNAFFRSSIFIAMLLATSVFFPDISPGAISFSGFDFGEVEIETTKTAVLTITNQDQTEIEISGIEFVQSNCSSFSLASGLGALSIPSNGKLDILVNFAPTETGACSDTLRIYTSTPFPSTANFTGTGVEPVQAAVETINPNTQYLRQIEAIESFTQRSIAQGSLEGVGKGKWRKRRLNALTKMLAVTGQMIEKGNFKAAHKKLGEIYKKIDGKPKPKDFVTGDARKSLASEVYTLMDALKSS